MRKRPTCGTATCRKWANLNDDGFCPTCQPPTEAQQDESDLTCNICDQGIPDDCRVVGCDLCHNWFHSKCVGPNALAELLEAIIDDESASKFLGNILWILICVIFYCIQ